MEDIGRRTILGTLGMARGNAYCLHRGNVLCCLAVSSPTLPLARHCPWRPHVYLWFRYAPDLSIFFCLRNHYFFCARAMTLYILFSVPFSSLSLVSLFIVSPVSSLFFRLGLVGFKQFSLIWFLVFCFRNNYFPSPHRAHKLRGHRALRPIFPFHREPVSSLSQTYTPPAFREHQVHYCTRVNISTEAPLHNSHFSRNVVVIMKKNEHKKMKLREKLKLP